MPELPINVVYFAGTVLGVLVLWLRKVRAGEIECIFDMVSTKRMSTLAAIAAQCVVALLVAVTQPFQGLDPQAALAAGMGIGAAIDALFNKGERKKWTYNERNSARKG